MVCNIGSMELTYFKDNPFEWSDLDDDGVGDNSDAFPNDATETTQTPMVIVLEMLLTNAPICHGVMPLKAMPLAA